MKWLLTSSWEIRSTSTGESLQSRYTSLSGETLRKVKQASDSLSFGLADQSISVVSKELKDTVGM